MIKVLSAYTRDPDNVEGAVADVLGQLNLQGGLLRHSLGVISFFADFMETGVVKALSEALPFDVIGGTTSASAIPGVNGDIVLTLTVLTSDEVIFKAGVSRPVGPDLRGAVSDLYTRLTSALTEAPAMLLIFAPKSDAGGDAFLEELDAVSGGVPVFGAVACSNTVDFSGICTCFNGERHGDALVAAAIAGPVRPVFHKSLIPDTCLLNQKAVITESGKNVVKSVNGILAAKYLESLGLIDPGDLNILRTAYFIVTLKDGSYAARIVQSITPEGYLKFLAVMPEGCALCFANYPPDFIDGTVEESMRTLNESVSARNAFIFSCTGRRWILGLRINIEMEKIDAAVSDSVNYHFAYSGGEFCPVQDAEGRLINRFHNLTLTVCAF
jgi:hypothetical protein